MIQMNLHQIAAIVGGSLVGKEARIQGVTTDSRGDCEGRLFVALSGANFNGANFCQAATAKGAAAVLVEQAVEVDVPQIICDNSLVAMQALAAAWIRQLDAKVVAVTGSNGKTTVKNMLVSVLKQRYKCCATTGNLNNEIGVPLTLLSVSKDDQVAIIEMGAAQLGDIKLLVEMARPNVALITNVSQAHIGRFGSEQNIATGKGEIYQLLTGDDLAVINEDSEYASQWRSNIKCKSISFGESAKASVQLIHTGGGYEVKVNNHESVPLVLPVLGHHNYLNACAVVAVAQFFELTTAEIMIGLAVFQPEPGRLNLVKVSEDFQVIDDSYNANPASMKAAIDVLKDMVKPTRLVLGHMAELGAEAEQMHAQVAQYALASGVDQILAVGPHAHSVCEGLGQKCLAFTAVEQLMSHVNANSFSTGAILVKGSRSMRLERVVEMITSGAKK